MKAMLFSLTVLLAAASAAAASDGVIEINQARALAGGVTPGDTPGFPVTINEPGSYRLTGDLDVSANMVGIQILAQHVSIDLNGFSIIMAAGSGWGVESNHFSDVSVSNGAVRGGGYGLFLNANVVRVDRVRVSDVAGTGILARTGALVSGCIVSNASTSGIWVDNGLVTGNVVVNSNVGLKLGAFSGTAYSGNTLTGNQTNVTGGVSLGSNLCGSSLCP